MPCPAHLATALYMRALHGPDAWWPACDRLPERERQAWAVVGRVMYPSTINHIRIGYAHNRTLSRQLP